MGKVQLDFGTKKKQQKNTWLGLEKVLLLRFEMFGLKMLLHGNQTAFPIWLQS